MGWSEELGRLCDRMSRQEVYQTWLDQVAGIARRRGGAMITRELLGQMKAYRDNVQILLGNLCDEGLPVVCHVGRGVVGRLAEAYANTWWLESVWMSSVVSLESHIVLAQAVALVNLRHSGRGAVIAVLDFFRYQAELPFTAAGGKGGEGHDAE